MAQKVLIIEDTAINLTLFTILFKKSGYDVHGANNAKEGLKMAKVMSFDLILCDLKMAGMDGSQLISLMKAEERLKNIPIVVISANTLEEMRVDKSLVAGYIAKPVQPGILIKKIQSILPPDAANVVDSRAKIKELEERAESRKAHTANVIEGFPVEPVAVSSLEVGMVTGDEVMDNNNLPVMPMGVALTEKYIEKLKSMDIQEILIRK